MKVLYFAHTDLGNGNKDRAEAMNRCTNWDARCMSIKETCYSDFPQTPDGLSEAVNSADFIHQSDMYPPGYGLDNLSNAGFCSEFRGGYLRMYSSTIFSYQSEHQTPIICPPELGRYVVRFHYIPIPMDMQKYRLKRGWDEVHKPLRIVHTPSRRDYKDTPLLEKVCKEVKGVELTLIEGKPLEEAIEAKRDSDICFGQIKVGSFGMAEKEAMAYGNAVIGRLLPIERAYNPRCPIIDAYDAPTLKVILERMVQSPDKVSELKRLGRHWTEQNLSYEAVAPREKALYEHIMYDDPQKDLWESFAQIWTEVGRREHNRDGFINPSKLRW